MKCTQPGCTGDDRRRLLRRVRDGPRAAPPRQPAAATRRRAAAAASSLAPRRHARDLRPPRPATRRRRSSRRSATAARDRPPASRLGAGLVEIPPVPARDPSEAVMADPMVPESRRFCARCGEPVGRGREGEPGRTSGFCRKCGTAFSFEPKLVPGDLVAGQYEVVGCHRPRRHGLGLPRARTTTCPTAGWSSRGCSTQATRTRWRPRWPSGGSWPRSSTRTSSRSSTSSSTRAPATSSWSTSGATASSRS